MNDEIQRKNATYLPAQSPAHKINDKKNYTNLKHLSQQSLAHKINVEILKEKYYKITLLLQQLTYKIIEKIYLLQEPKKSPSAVALLQNQL